MDNLISSSAKLSVVVLVMAEYHHNLICMDSVLPYIEDGFHLLYIWVIECIHFVSKVSFPAYHKHTNITFLCCNQWYYNTIK